MNKKPILLYFLKLFALMFHIAKNIIFKIKWWNSHENSKLFHIFRLWKHDYVIFYWNAHLLATLPGTVRTVNFYSIFLKILGYYFWHAWTFEKLIGLQVYMYVRTYVLWKIMNAMSQCTIICTQYIITANSYSCNVYYLYLTFKYRS